MQKTWITAAKSVVVALVAGSAVWTVGGAAAHTLGQAGHTGPASTSVVAENGTWPVAPVN